MIGEALFMWFVWFGFTCLHVCVLPVFREPWLCSVKLPLPCLRVCMSRLSTPLNFSIKRRNNALASMRCWVQTPVPPKEKDLFFFFCTNIKRC
jgi:hypothetical protein